MTLKMTSRVPKQFDNVLPENEAAICFYFFIYTHLFLVVTGQKTQLKHEGLLIRDSG